MSNKHNLDTKKALIPIPVYNADGTRNQGGDITEFVELSMTIGDHREHIDLAVTISERRTFTLDMTGSSAITQA